MQKIIISVLFLTFSVFAGELIFECDFSNNEEGLYTFDQVKADWKNPKGESPSWNNGVDDGRTSIISEFNGQEKVLAVKFPKLLVGTSESGAQWKYAFGEKFDSATVEYKVFFPAGGDWGGGGKLPGLGGGTAPTGCNSTDGTDGFTARIMWRSGTNKSDTENVYPTQYLYFRDKISSCGDDFYWGKLPDDLETTNAQLYNACSPMWYNVSTNYGNIWPCNSWKNLKPYISFFKAGEWNTVRTYIKVNDIDKTEKGNSNSVIKTWLNDELVLDLQGLVLRTTDNFAVDMFYFSTFSGGSSADFAPQEKDQIYYFDDFKIWEGEKPAEIIDTTGDNDTINKPDTSVVDTTDTDTSDVVDTTDTDTTQTAIAKQKKQKTQPIINIQNRNLFVSIPNSPNMSISVFTPNGRRIVKRNVYGEKANIMLPKSAKGIVIVTIDANRNYYSQRISVD